MPHSAVVRYSVSHVYTRVAVPLVPDHLDHSPLDGAHLLEDGEISLCHEVTEVLFCLAERVMEDLVLVHFSLAEMARFYHEMETLTACLTRGTQVSGHWWDHSAPPLSAAPVVDLRLRQ